MQAMANEAKHGPRFFTIEPAEGGKTVLTKPILSNRCKLQLWCEGNNYEHAHSVSDEGKGVYELIRQANGSSALRRMRTLSPEC
jgi:hypothetical protein